VVDDLLVDVTQNEVVMLDVIPSNAGRKEIARPHAAVPLKAAWIDREHHRVILDGAQFDVDAGLPWEVRPTPVVEAPVARAPDVPADRPAERAAERADDRAADRVDRVNDEIDDAGRRRGVVVEEHVVRRRIVDPSEIDERP
jgi:hypothetical protein